MNRYCPIRCPRPVTAPVVADCSVWWAQTAVRTVVRPEVIRALHYWENTLGTFADQVVSEETKTEERRPIRDEWTVTMCWITMKEAISGIFGLVEDTVTALVTPKATMEFKGRKPD